MESINVPEILLSDLPVRNARHFNNKWAVICGAERVTWGELDSYSDKFANVLGELGAVPGDRVAIIANNCVKWVVAYFGSAKAGTYFCAIPSLFTEDEKKYCLELVRANILIIDENQYDFVKKMRSQMDYVKHYISISGAQENDILSLSDLMVRVRGIKTIRHSRGSDLCDILFTTGTTGLPKGPAFTHQAVIWKAISSAISYEYQRNSVSLASGPLFHTGALSTTLNPISFIGGTAIFLPKFSEQELLRTVEKERVTHLTMIASIMLMCLQEIERDKGKYDLSSVCTLIIAAGALPENRLKQTFQLFPNAKIKYTLGTTEGMAAFLDLPVELRNDPFWATKLRSQGFPAYGVEIRAVDDADEDVPKGQVGEMIFRSPGIPCRYWGRQDLTEELLRKGWVHSGDLIKIDDDGFIWFVDRKKDIIKSGGENIYAPEVENVLHQHDAVLDAAVVGVPDEKWGEAVMAFIQLKPGHYTDPDELIAFCRTKLPGYRCPKRVKFINCFPRNPVGKILKKKLRASIEVA